MNFVEKVKKLQNYFTDRKFKKVIEGCEELNKKFPNNSFILNLAGMAFQKIEKHQKAISFFEAALKVDSSNTAAMNNLGNSLKNTGKLVEAEQIFKKIINRNPNYINVYNNYANLKIEVNDFEGALTLYKKALSIAEKNKINTTNFLIQIATTFQSLNKLKESIEAINEILKIYPEDVNAHNILSSIYKYSNKNNETMEHISKMKDIFKNSDLNEDQRMQISFALGKAYDDLKDVKEAIKFISYGNKLKKDFTKSNIAEEIKIMTNIKNMFNDINLEKNHKILSEKKFIFICGMPRSGTTLTEQIIASHKKVYGAGELSFLTSIIYENFLNENKLSRQKFFEHQKSLKNSISDQYLKKLSLHNINEQFITDKAPFNFKWIGFIKVFFPNSKVIHCRRNAKDICLSIFKNSFASSQMNWSYDQKDISNYYNNYHLLMKFWQTKIPEFIYTVDYEKLVSDKKNQIKKLLDFCELEWDDNCLNHHKNNKTPIRSVSVSQARQPIYNSSVNSGDNYKDHLKDMFENLI